MEIEKNKIKNDIKEFKEGKKNYYLSYGMRNWGGKNVTEINFESPFDKTKIQNAYIPAHGEKDFIDKDNGKIRDFKCAALHPIIEDEDIVSYSYGGVGYDFNKEDTLTYIGGWSDLKSNSKANELLKKISKKEIKDGKHNELYYDSNGKVADKMVGKILNRADLLKNTCINEDPGVDKKDDIKKMSSNSDKTLDDSFSDNRYNVSVYNNTLIPYDYQRSKHEKVKYVGTRLPYNYRSMEDDYNNLGLSSNSMFGMCYDFQTKKFFMDSCEILCQGKDKEGIKVDGIFLCQNLINDFLDRDKGGPGYCGLNTFLEKLCTILIQEYPKLYVRIINSERKSKEYTTEQFINEWVAEYDKYFAGILNNKLEEKKKEIEGLSDNNHQYNQKQINNDIGKVSDKGNQKCPGG